MMRCKNCHEKLTRLDKDICPFCGTLKPLEGQEDVTEDMTKAFDSLNLKEEYHEVKAKSRLVAAILAMTLGVFGVHAFYLGKMKRGLINLIVSICFIAGIGSILFFSGALKNALAFLIPYFFLEIIMIVVGVIILKKRDEVDGNGEFLK